MAVPDVTALLAYFAWYLGILAYVGGIVLFALGLWLLWHLTPPGGRHD